MRRIVASGVHAGLIALLVSVAGCDGGVDEGVPKDITPVVPLDTIKANMNTRNVPPTEANKGESKPAPPTKP